MSQWLFPLGTGGRSQERGSDEEKEGTVQSKAVYHAAPLVVDFRNYENRTNVEGPAELLPVSLLSLPLPSQRPYYGNLP